MSEFGPAYQNTARNEGGWTDDPHETAFGIDRLYWPGWTGWPIVDAVKAKVGKDRKKISQALRADRYFMAMVSDFYQRNFWLPNYNRIENQAVANFVFDRAVNIGTKQMHIYLQRVLGIAADGIFGKDTLFHVNQQEPAAFVKQLDQYVDEHHYKRLARDHPEKYGKYEDTWEHRT